MRPSTDPALLPLTIASVRGECVEASADPVLSGVEGAVEVRAARPSGELLLTKYYYVNGLRIAQARKAGSAAWGWTWSHSDHLGSATVLADKDGNVVWRLAYKPFGEEVVNSGAGEKGREILEKNDTHRHFASANCLTCRPFLCTKMGREERIY